MDLDSGNPRRKAALTLAAGPSAAIRSGYTAGVRNVRVALLLALAVVSSGCLVLSLQPAYDDQSLIFDEALVGHWENAEDQTAVTFERAEWRSYKVTYSDRFATWAFHANLTKVGTRLLLDLSEPTGTDPGPSLIPVHALYRVAVDGDTLTASALDYDWFSDAMARRALGRLAVALDGRRNEIVTSSTTQFRAWLAHAPAAAFGAPMTFSRKT